MKTKNIVIAGAIVILGFLYWKNKKKTVVSTTDTAVAEEETTSSGSGGGGYVGGGISMPETPTGTSIVTENPLADTTPSASTKTTAGTPTTGTSVVAPDPLAEANAQAQAKALADQAKALVDSQAQAQVQQALLDQKAQAQADQQKANNLAQAKIISKTIQDNIRKRNGYKKGSSVRNIQNVIDADVTRLRALGYTSLSNGDVQPI